jgi:hypothetical protein
MKKLLFIAVIIAISYQVYIQSQPKLTVNQVEAFIDSFDTAFDNQDYKSYESYYDLRSVVRYTNQPNVSENKTITIKMMFKSIRTMWRNGIYFESETQNQRITISKNEQEAIVETTESVTITHNGMLLEKTTGFSIVTVKLTEGRLLITDTEIRGEG